MVHVLPEGLVSAAASIFNSARSAFSALQVNVAFVNALTGVVTIFSRLLALTLNCACDGFEGVIRNGHRITIYWHCLHDYYWLSEQFQVHLLAFKSQ